MFTEEELLKERIDQLVNAILRTKNLELIEVFGLTLEEERKYRQVLAKATGIFADRSVKDINKRSQLHHDQVSAELEHLDESLARKMACMHICSRAYNTVSTVLYDEDA